MLLPYTVDVPMERVPVANWVLIGFTVLVSLVVFVSGRQSPTRQVDPELDRLLLELEKPGLTAQQKESLMAQIVQRLGRQGDDGEHLILRLAIKPGAFSLFNLFSHQFVHGDFLHLFGNMLFLFVFGNAVNAKLGHGSYLVAYLLLGAFAGLAWTLLGDGTPAVGASGAIAGIVGIFLVLFPRNDVSVLYWFGLAIAGTFALSSVWLILFYFAWDLYGSIAAGGGGIAYIAHLGGTIAGFALAIGLVRWRWVESTEYEQNLLELVGWQTKPVRRRRK